MIQLYFGGISIGCCGVLTCILSPKRKDRFHLWAIIYFGFIALMVAKSKNNYIDIINYRYLFEGMRSIIPNNVTDAGFYTIVGICKYVFGFSFQQTKAFILIVALLLLFRILLKYMSDLSLFFICYFSYFMFLDGEQLRNFLAFMIILNGLDFLLQGGKRNTIFFIVAIVIASTIHLMSVLFLLFLLIKMDSIKIIRYLIFPYILIALALFRYGGVFNSIAGIAGIFINRSAQEKLFTYAASTTNMGAFIPLFLFSVVTYLVWWAKKTQRLEEIDYANCFQIKQGIIYSEKHNSYTFLADKIMHLQLVGYLMFPLCILNLTFYRYIRNIALIDVIFLCGCFNGSRNKNRKVLFLVSCVMIIFFFRFWDFSLYSDWNEFVACYF